MEKKNTMLLTVIAVATLLVAVVGATFAYFSITATSNGKTAATITAQNVGSVVLSTVEDNTTLKLSLTADDMAFSNQGNKYYANPKGTGDKTSDEQYDIANIAYSDGEAGVNYKCPVKVEVSISGDMLPLLQEGWSSIDLYGDAVSKSTTDSDNGITKDAESGKVSIELTKVKDSSGSKLVTLHGETTVTGASMSAKPILKTSIWLENARAEQATIAEKDLTVKIDVKPEGECTIAS